MTHKRRDRSHFGMRRRQRRLVYALLLGLWGSGLAWLGVHYFLAATNDFGLLSPSPLEPWMLALHGAFAFLSLLLFGWLLGAHIPPGWRSQRSRQSALALLSAFLLLIVSGYLLYYCGNDQLRQLISMFHWALGLAGLLLFGWHLRQKRSV